MAGVKLNTPFVSARAAPSTMPLSEMVTVEPTSAVPVMVGVASLVRPGAVVRVGASGAMLSMVRATATEAGDTLPTRSCAVAVRTLLPAVSGMVGVKLKPPFMPATAVPITIPLSKMVKVAPASAVPVMVGVVSFVGPANAVMLGARGPTVSTSTVTGAAGEGRPPKLVAVTSSALVPSASGTVRVTLKRPPVSAVPEPTVLPFLVIVIRSPARAVPVMMGVSSLVGAT